MLILSRKRGEELVIGNGVRLRVLEVQGDRVKLGFVAPTEVPIHRKEVHLHGGLPCTEVTLCPRLWMLPRLRRRRRSVF